MYIYVHEAYYLNSTQANDQTCIKNQQKGLVNSYKSDQYSAPLSFQFIQTLVIKTELHQDYVIIFIPHQFCLFLNFIQRTRLP